MRFKANTVPGDIIQTLAIWDRALLNTEILKIDSTERVFQRIQIDDRQYDYTWRFDIVNDSLTRVEVVIEQAGNSFMNKLLVPFTKQDIEVDAEITLREFYEVVKEHLKITGVTIDGITDFDEKFCACYHLTTRQIEKAEGMMKTYPPLSSFIADNNFQLNGKPIIEVENWDHNKGVLSYNFCFPIITSDSLPQDEEIFYKTIAGTKALKAIYNGNYITSDRAWYNLKRYANQENIELQGFPIEVFYNNPNMGIDEEKWKAEVYWPIKSK